MTYYKNIIIGAGMAGIYLAYQLKKMNESFIVLEKNNYIGGRIKWCHFHGKEISLGAGIMRKSDHAVMELCKELGIECGSYDTEFIMHPSIKISAENVKNMKESILQKFKREYDEIKKRNLTFREFLQLYFEPDFITNFMNIIMYHDFLDADVEESIKYYPIDDFFPGKDTKYFVKGGWQKLINALVDYVGENNIILSDPVFKIDSKNKLVKTCNHEYHGERIFICTDININKISLQIPIELHHTLNQIGSVPFMRSYSYHPAGHNIPNMVVPGFLGKIIKIDEEILMISYTEAENATNLSNFLEKYDNPVNAMNTLLLNALLNTDYDYSYCSDTVHKYWDIGIHYYKPHTEELIKYSGNVYLVGEFVSHSQGWVNGAIESVNEVIKKLNR